MLQENDLISEDLAGYRMTVELDAHSSSRIFLGESISPTTADQRVAIKLLSTIHVQTQQEQERILQELSSLQELRHPHILPIQAVGMYKEIPYIITEYIATGSLHTRLLSRPAPLSQEEGLSMLGQIGQALYYAHQRQVMHGNLRPHNVFFAKQGGVLLTGFQPPLLLAADKVEEANHHDASIYQAPEQLAGHICQESDQYALGCLAYEIFTGRKAFTIPSISSPGTYYRTKSPVPPRRLNPTLPLHIEIAILKAISKEPIQRHHDMMAFLGALGIYPESQEAAILNLPITLIPESPMTPEPLQGKEAAVLELPVTPMPALAALEQIPFPLTADDVDEPQAWHNQATIKTPLPFAPNPQENQKKPSPQRRLIGKTLREEKLSGASQKALFKNVRERLKLHRTLAVVMCLVAVVVVAGSLFVASSFSTTQNNAGTTSYTYVRLTTQSPTLSSPTAITSSLTPGIQVPLQGGIGNATPTSASTPTSSSSTPTSSSSTPTPPTSGPPQGPTATSVPSSTQAQVSLSSFFNNQGIGSAPGQANFDGSGYAYPANQLPSGGQITVQGIQYQFPDNGYRTKDNIIASGQAISLPSGRYHQAFLLAAASWGPISGTMTVRYTDGSTASTRLTVPDWYAGPSNGLKTAYRYSPNSIDWNVVYIYVVPITLDSTRTVDQLILPWQQSWPYRNNQQYPTGHMHIFALTLQS